MEPDHRDYRCLRPKAFDKMEELVREMQDTEQGGVPVRSQKLFLTSIPAAFMGYDLIEWLMMRLEIEESEALNIANQLCQYGYFFPISDSKNLVVKDDSSLYRFQSPYYWPWQNKPPDNVDYAIYLAKRTLRNKQRHGLEDYELEAMNNLKKNLANKWDIITAQAEEQISDEEQAAKSAQTRSLVSMATFNKVKLSKAMKKPDKLISDSQEKAYWRVYRPPPGIPSSLEQVPVPTRNWNGCKQRKKAIEDCKREVELLKHCLYRTRIKVSQALDSMVQHVETYTEYDPLLTPTQPSNPWVSEDLTYWQLNSPLVEIPTEKRVRRWGLSMEDLLSDPTGVQEFTNYLKKEKSEENILFWLAVNDLRRSAQSQIISKIQEIYSEYVKLGSPGEVNIDNQTMDKVVEGMKNNSRFCFDAAQEHVYNLLLKKDCYPRFIRSDYYKNLLATGIQPSQKKRFFVFGQTKKKASTSATPNQQQIQQPQQSSSSGVMCGALSKRRGSDRSLTGSAHELAVAGVNKDSKVPHSHSQSNLSDIPYRVKKPSIVAGASTSEEVCPWEAAPSPHSSPPRLRKNSTHIDSESSSSDVSVAVAELTEKVQRCMLTQQHTVDGGKKLSATTCEPPRRASVSVPITHSSTSSSGADTSKRKVSSFENTQTSATTSTAVFAIPSDKDNKPEESTSTTSSTKTLTKSHSIAKTSCCSNAPIISVSSAADDIVDEDTIPDEECPEEVTPTSSETSTEVPEPQVAAAQACGREPLAPLAEPDSESPASELPPSEMVVRQGGEEGEEGGSKEGEAKSNDVCPWEDEETCKVDTPFVKTYATLGYL